MPFTNTKELNNIIKSFAKEMRRFIKAGKKIYDGLNKSTKFKNSFSNPSAEIGDRLNDFRLLCERVLKGSASPPSAPRSATPGTN